MRPKRGINTVLFEVSEQPKQVFSLLQHPQMFLLFFRVGPEGNIQVLNDSLLLNVFFLIDSL